MEELSLVPMLPVMSFSIALGGLLVRLFLPVGPAKQTLLTSSLIFLLFIAGTLWRDQQALNERVMDTADEIIRTIGNEKVTFDDVVGRLRLPDYVLAERAVDLLIRTERIGTDLISLGDESGSIVRVRRYYVRTFNAVPS